MNKTFTSIFAGALAAASLFALASCGDKKSEDDKSANAATPSPATEAPITEAPTAAPTPTPEPTPTSEPTATPVPSDWYIDPGGNIPPEVEVVSQPIIPYDIGYCIAHRDGKYYFQQWDNMEILIEYEVPDLMASYKKMGYERWFDSPFMLLAYNSSSRFGLNEDVEAFCWIGLDGTTFSLPVKDYFYYGSEYIALIFILEDNRVMCFDLYLEKCWQLDVGKPVRFNESRMGLIDEDGNTIVDHFAHFEPNGKTAQTLPGEPSWEMVELG